MITRGRSIRKFSRYCKKIYEVTGITKKITKMIEIFLKSLCDSVPSKRIPGDRGQVR
jgi:hypothetical protein